MLEAKALPALLVALALSGCASVPGTDPTESLGTQDADLARLSVLLTLEAAEVDSGAALNLSLEAVAGTPGAVLDLQNATWTIEVLAVGNATAGMDGAPGEAGQGGEGCSGNVTVDLGSGNCQDGGAGNSTADGNATQDGNATVPDAPAGPAVSLNGTGLPFAGNLTVDGNGTFQVVATVTAAGFETATTAQDLTVLGVVAAVDPCAGFAGPQEPFAASGSVLLPDDVGVHEFALGPCHTRIHGVLDAVGGDLDWFLYDPSGKQVAGAATYSAEPALPEGDLVVEDAAGLPAGTWRVEVLNYASVATDYTVQLTFE